MFARNKRDRWDGWGDQAALFNGAAPVKTRRWASDLTKRRDNPLRIVT